MAQITGWMREQIITIVNEAWKENIQAILFKSIDGEEAKGLLQGIVIPKVYEVMEEPEFIAAYKWSSQQEVNPKLLQAIRNLWIEEAKDVIEKKVEVGRLEQVRPVRRCAVL